MAQSIQLVNELFVTQSLHIVKMSKPIDHSGNVRICDIFNYSLYMMSF